MFKLSYSDIVNEIKNKTNISEEELNIRVNKKLKLLGDLISKEGAAHIIANELGVKLFPEVSDKKLKIGSLVPGLNFINIDAKVIAIYETRNFKSDKREGRVANMLIGDETGVTRLVVWDTKLIDKIENNKLKDLDVISIKNGYSRENNGNIELHLGTRGDIIIRPENIEIKEIKNTKIVNLKNIKDIKENENVELNGTIVQLFEPKFYVACTQCNRKTEFVNGIYVCNEHGNTITKEIPILNFFLDDGTDSIRVVCFRELVNKVLDNNFSKIRENPNEFENVKRYVLGKQVKVYGRVTKNLMFDRLEFTAQNIEELDHNILLEQLNKEN